MLLRQNDMKPIRNCLQQLWGSTGKDWLLSLLPHLFRDVLAATQLLYREKDFFRRLQLFTKFRSLSFFMEKGRDLYTSGTVSCGMTFFAFLASRFSNVFHSERWLSANMTREISCEKSTARSDFDQKRDEASHFDRLVSSSTSFRSAHNHHLKKIPRKRPSSALCDSN